MNKIEDSREFYIKLGDSISRYRAYNKLTQQDMADKLEIALGTMNAWETGKRKMDAYHLVLIAKNLNLTLDELLKFSDHEPKVEND